MGLYQAKKFLHSEGKGHLPTVQCLVAQSCPTLCDPMNCSPPGSSGHGDSPGKNFGVGCHALLQGIFPKQGWNPGLPHCRQILYQRSHQGSLSFDWFDLQFSRVLLNPKLNKYLLVTLASPLLVENRVNSQDS